MSWGGMLVCTQRLLLTSLMKGHCNVELHRGDPYTHFHHPWLRAAVPLIIVLTDQQVCLLENFASAVSYLAGRESMIIMSAPTSGISTRNFLGSRTQRLSLLYCCTSSHVTANSFRQS